VSTNINEQPSNYVVVSYFWLSKEATFTDWLSVSGDTYLGFEPGWNYILVRLDDVTENHLFIHEDRLKLDVSRPLISVTFKRADYSINRPLTVRKAAMLSMIEKAEVDRSLCLTPDDIVWLREWLSKAKDSNVEYEIHVYLPSE
jgi:hypothetical protein